MEQLFSALHDLLWMVDHLLIFQTLLKLFITDGVHRCPFFIGEIHIFQRDMLPLSGPCILIAVLGGKRKLLDRVASGGHHWPQCTGLLHGGPRTPCGYLILTQSRYLCLLSGIKCGESREQNTEAFL